MVLPLSTDASQADGPASGPRLFDKIIVPLDGSPEAARALSVARALVADHDAEIVVASILAPDADGSTAEVIRGQLASSGLGDVDLDLIVSRRPAASLVQYLAGEPFGLLCMATSARSRLGQMMGSVAEEVLRARSGPTVLVGPRCQPDSFRAGGRMQLPVDGSRVAAEILPLAAAWAVAYGLVPELVTVVDPTLEGRGRMLAAGRRCSRQAARWLSLCPTRLMPRSDRRRLVGADVPAALVRHAQRVGASIIAVTTHGRTAVGRVLLGSVAMDVIHTSPCPVLLHRPPRFRA